MSLHHKVGGVQKNVAQFYHKVGGVWKLCKLYERVGGVWKIILDTLAVFTTAVTFTQPGNSSARTNQFSCTVSGAPGGSKFEYYLEDTTTLDQVLIASSATTSPRVFNAGIYNPSDYVVLQTVRIYVKVYNSSDVLIGYARSNNIYDILGSFV